MARADKFTQLNKKQELFSDFLDNFDRHPITNNIAITTNETAIKQSIKNLVLTNVGERMFENDVGSNVEYALFEPNDVASAEMLTHHISHTIETYEPRAKLINVTVTPSPDSSWFTVNIVFSVINNIQPVTLDLILRRVR